MFIIKYEKSWFQNSAQMRFLSFLIIVSIILITARVLGEICRKYKQPAVIGEILAGIILGPSLFGWLFPTSLIIFLLHNQEPLQLLMVLQTWALYCLCLLPVLKLILKQIRKQGKPAASISIMGLVFPFALGFATVYLFYNNVFSVPTHKQSNTCNVFWNRIIYNSAFCNCQNFAGYGYAAFQAGQSYSYRSND